MKQVNYLKTLSILLAILWIGPASAQIKKFQYLRFEPLSAEHATGEHAGDPLDYISINEIEFHNGLVSDYPNLAFEGPTATIEATLTDAHSYKAFDQQDTSSAYFDWSGSNPNNEQVVLDFGSRQVPVTRCRFHIPSWARLTGLKVEGSNDNQTWETLYAGTGLSMTNGWNEVSFTASVDNTVDANPPGTPTGLSVTGVTHNSVDLSWSAVSDPEGSPVTYEIRINGAVNGYTSATTYSSDNSLSPSTSNTIAVRALDGDFNASAAVTTTATTSAAPAAGAYQYLRFQVIEGAGTKAANLEEVYWMVNDKEFPVVPIQALSTDTKNSTIVSMGMELTSDGFTAGGAAVDWRIYDKTPLHMSAGDNPWQEVTLPINVDLKLTQAIHPTGVTIDVGDYDYLGGFACYGKLNESDSWTLLYKREGLSIDDYDKDATSKTLPTLFDFGTVASAYESTPPTTPGQPSLTAQEPGQAAISWSGATDASGIIRYNVYVNGAFWTWTTNTSATVYGLSPNEAYQITVTALDNMGNESAASTALSVTGTALPAAQAPMLMGTNLGGRTASLDGNKTFASEFDFASSNFVTDNPYSTEFLNDVDPVNVYRFMDWAATPHTTSLTIPASVSDWQQRRKHTDADQTGSVYVDAAKGVAWEWMIRLCNIKQKHMWVTIHHKATDSYVDSLAQLIYNHLDSNLDVYVELGNETWNPTFRAYEDLITEGEALNLDDLVGHSGNPTAAGAAFHVYQAVRWHKRFKDVFGAESGRVKGLLAGQAGWQFHCEVHLTALQNSTINPYGTAGYPAGYAIAPYYGLSAGNVNDTEITDVARMEQIVEDAKLEVVKHFNLIEGFNSDHGASVELIAYEGGQHMIPGYMLSTNPYIYNMYIDYLDAVAPLFDAFMHYTSPSKYTVFGAWGYKDEIGDDDHTSFKFRALRDWYLTNQNTQEPTNPIWVNSLPAATQLDEFTSVTLEVLATAGSAVTYEWLIDGVVANGETGPTFELSNVSQSMNQSVVTARATANGQTISTQTTLDVLPANKVSLTERIGTITIDGADSDAGWGDAATFTLDSINKGSGTPSAADLSATGKVMWDASALYVVVNVSDQTLTNVADNSRYYEYDGIEIYVDADGSRNVGSYDGANDFQISIPYNNPLGSDVFVAGANANTSAFERSIATTTGGYLVELKMPWSALNVSPKSEGDRIGFDLMVIDNDGSSNVVEHKKAFYAAQDNSWSDPSLFAVGILGQEGSNPPPGGGGPSVTLAQWEFAGSNCPATESADVLDSDLATASVGLGSGVLLECWGGNDQFTGRDFTASTLAQAITNGDYLTIAIDAATGKSVSIDSVKFRGTVQGSVTHTFALFSDHAGFSAADVIDEVQISNQNNSGESYFLVSGHEDLTSVNFRVYVYSSASQNAYETVGFGRSTGDDLKIIGTIGSGGSAPPATVETLGHWDFAGANCPSSDAADFTHAQVTTASAAFGSGVIAECWGQNNQLSGRHFASTSLAAAIANDDYITISLAAASGSQLSIDSVKLRGTSQNSVSRTYVLFSDHGGFQEANEIDRVTVANQNESPLQTLAVSGHTGLASVELRIYIYGASTNEYETVGLGRSTGNDLIVEGSVSASGSRLTTSQSAKGQLEFYPNPTSDLVWVTGLDTDEPTEISLLDLSGKVLQSKVAQGTNRALVDVSQLRDGVYLLQLKTDNGVSTHRLVKE